jgi:hypothetical protein
MGEQAPAKRVLFGPEWEDVYGDRRDGINLDLLVGYETVPMLEPNVAAIALKLAETPNHMAAIKAGTAKPKRVQFGISPEGLLQLAAAFTEMANEMKAKKH